MCFALSFPEEPVSRGANLFALFVGVGGRQPRRVRLLSDGARAVLVLSFLPPVVASVPVLRVVFSTSITWNLSVVIA